MRRRLVTIVVGLTVLVVAGFAIPLALVVRQIQRDDGVDAAVAAGSSLAAFIDNDTSPAAIAKAIGRLEVETPEYEVTVYGRDGSKLGTDKPRNELVDLAFGGRESTVHSNGGLIDYAPNNGPFAGPSDYVIRVEAPASAIEPDLSSFRLVLALSIAVALAAATAAGVLAARSIARPTRALTAAARRLERGELDTEIPESGPPEVRELARTLAHLSARIQALLHTERETAADLAHRMRTPLTALHLELESLPAGDDRTRLLARAQRTERLLDEVIAELRRPAGDDSPEANLLAVVADRVGLWEEVASERGYRLQADLPAGACRVAASTADLEAAIDVLIDNVVTHTPTGTTARVTVAEDDGSVRLTVADDGPGPAPGTVVQRGVSAGSSGLGLDIARRTAERAGGRFELATPPAGGLAVTLTFPLLAR